MVIGSRSAVGKAMGGKLSAGEEEEEDREKEKREGKSEREFTPLRLFLYMRLDGNCCIILYSIFHFYFPLS